ncbi:MAG: adenosine deaminase, partial [Thermoanaerobaculia bacterium]|nr:adenosine deaminase [Thermoanaerobaculia bacterium]
MTNVSSRAWRCVAALSLFAAASSFAQPALNVSDRVMLRQVLQAMPKGGDLHNHLSGSIYAESYLQYAANDGICLDTVKLTITQCPTAASTSIVPAATVLQPYSSLYGEMLDALSMRQFRSGVESGHDHFFNTFGKFSAVSKTHVPEMLTQDVWRLASENVDYLETIFAPDFGSARDLLKVVKPGQSYSEMRTAMMQSGLVPPIITSSRA